MCDDGPHAMMAGKDLKHLTLDKHTVNRFDLDVSFRRRYVSDLVMRPRRAFKDLIDRALTLP